MSNGVKWFQMKMLVYEEEEKLMRKALKAAKLAKMSPNVWIFLAIKEKLNSFQPSSIQKQKRKNIKENNGFYFHLH